MCGRSSNLSAGQTAAAAASVLRSGRLSLAMKSDGRAELGMAPRPVWKSQGKHEQRDVQGQQEQQVGAGGARRPRRCSLAARMSCC